MLESKNETNNRPFLRWAGSKRQLVPELSKYWGDGYSRYIEPFVGSASLFFYLSPKLAILGDLNSELIAMYQQVKSNLPAVLSELNTMKRSKEEYLRLRATKPDTLKPDQRAARFIYLNRYCFNGLYRTNRAGEFNVPYGGDKSGELPTVEVLKRCSLCLKSAKLVKGSFEHTLEMAQPGDFVYMDPPFSVTAWRVFNEYNAMIFSKHQLQVLRNYVMELNAKGIKFVISYAECEEGISLGKGFHIEKVAVRRNIAGFTASRRKTSELLISNVIPANGGGLL
jgi:DNA adenine methylase